MINLSTWKLLRSATIQPDTTPEIKKRGKPVVKKKNAEKPEETDPQAAIKVVKRLIATSISDIADENGWAYLGDVGNLILKKQPDFDPRNFGFPKLTPLIRSLDFEIDERESGQNNIKHIYIRNRK